MGWGNAFGNLAGSMGRKLSDYFDARDKAQFQQQTDYARAQSEAQAQAQAKLQSQKNTFDWYNQMSPQDQKKYNSMGVNPNQGPKETLEDLFMKDPKKAIAIMKQMQDAMNPQPEQPTQQYTNPSSNMSVNVPQNPVDVPYNRDRVHKIANFGNL